MTYHITLTHAEFSALQWMAARWAAPSKLYESITPFVEGETETEYTISEPDAWEINELAGDPDDGFTCLNWSSNLGEKVRKLLESIV